MAGYELATAYVTLAVESSQISKAIGAGFAGGDKVAAKSGKTMGKAMGDAFAKEKGPDFEKLAADAEKADKRVQASAEQVARKRGDAARQVEIAEQKLLETREKSIARDKDVVSAEKQLSNARKQSDPAEIAAAEDRLARARDAASPTSADMAAEDRLAKAKRSYVDVSRDGVETLSRFAKEQDQANRKLTEAKRAAENADRSTEKAAGAFARMGDRVKSAMQGNFRDTFRRVERDGENAAEEIERDFRRSGDDAARGFGGSFKAGLAGALGGLATYVGLSEVIDVGKFAITGAADLEQSIGGVQTVFKENADQMLIWSAAADQALGLTENEYNEFAARLGASLKNAGTPMDELGAKTDGLITMGADLASLYGGTTAEAVDALGSALRGEMDPIERYGISLNAAALDAEGLALGMKKNGGSWSTQEKQLISLSLLQKQSADATGNFAREQSTASNVAQRLTAKLKETAAEVGGRLTPHLANLGSWFLDKGIPALESFGTGVQGVWSILADGDFKGAENTFGLEEDSGIVDFLFNIREGFVAIWDGIKGWISSDAGQEFFGNLRDVGLQLWEDVLKPFGTWFMEQVPQFLPTLGKLGVAFAAVAAVIVGIGLGAIIAQFMGAMAVGVGVVWPVLKWTVDFMQNTVWPVLVTVFQAIGDAAVWLWRNALAPAWSGIQAAVAAVVGWVTGTAVPGLQSAWNAISAAATWLWKNILQPVWDGIRIAIAVAVTAVIVAMDLLKWYWSNVIAPAALWLWKNVITPAWNGIKAAIGVVVGWIANTAWPAIKRAWDAIAAAALWLWNSALKPAWAGIRAAISVVVNWLTDTAWPLIKKVWNAIADGATWLWKNVITPAWDGIRSAIRPVVDWLSSTIKPKIDDFTDKVSKGFTNLKDGVLKAWDGIRDGLKRPINGVIGIYNTHIKDNFNKVIDTIFGDEGAAKYKLKAMTPFATGGYTGPGSKYQPAGVVHADEFVIRKESQNSLARQAPGFLDALNTHGARALSDMGFGYAGGGKVLGGWREIAAIPHKGMAITSTVRRGARTAGSGSVSKHAQGLAVDFAGAAGAMRSFFNFVRDNYSVSELIHTPMGGRQLSRGGRPRANFPAATARSHYNHVHVGGWGAGEKAGAGAFAGASTSGSAASEWSIPNPFDGLWSSIQGKVTDAVGGGALGGMLSQTVENTVGGIKGWVTGKIDSITGAVETGVGAARWTPMAINALTREGQMSPGNLDSLLRRMNQESGYNPQAINNWDSNAAKGTPSKGLMQVIQPTFNAHRDPSLPNDIWNPLANTVASIRYAMSRYGSVQKAYDRPGGYANGGYTGAGPKHAPAGIVHADEFVLRSEAQRSISKAAPGFLDRLNRMGASAIGYAKGGLVGYASGGKVSPNAKIGSSKVTVILDGLLGTEKQVKTATGKLADGIAKTFQDRFKADQKQTVDRLSDSLKALKNQASQLNKTVSAKSSVAKKSTVNRLSDDLVDLRKQQKALDPKKQASQLAKVRKQIDSTQSALTKARRGDYSSAASATAAKLKDVQKQIASTEAALKSARRGQTSTAATKAADAFFTKYAASATTKLQNLAKQSDTLTSKLKTANAALADAVKVRDGYASSLTEKFAGAYALTDTSATTGIETIIRGFQNAAATVTTFQGQLATLRSRGLSDGLIDQIAQLGSESGSKVARNLLTGTDSQIAQITEQYTALNKASTKSGSRLGKQMHQAGVDGAQGLVDGLKSQLGAVSKASESLANVVVKTVTKKLDIHSPSRVAYRLAEFFGQGWVGGVESQIPAAERAVFALAATPDRAALESLSGTLTQRPGELLSGAQRSVIASPGEWDGRGDLDGRIVIKDSVLGPTPQEIAKAILAEERKQQKLRIT